MNEPRKILTAEQSALVNELVENYGIEPDQVVFFEDSVKPFLFYEANAALCNQLTNLYQIGVEPVTSQFSDAVAIKCTVVTADGRERSAVGVANLSEKNKDSNEVSYQQAINLASSRALRAVLRAAGIDLIKLHRQATATEGELSDVKPKSNRAALIGQAHKLGIEIGLIFDDQKQPWRNVLATRYGVTSSASLMEEQLADFVAFLNTLAPTAKAAA